MNKYALTLLAAMVGLSSANAAVKYIGDTSDSDVTTIIDLSTGTVFKNNGSGAAVSNGTPLTLADGYDSATKTWTWSASNTYVLQELVFITNGTLSIEAGSVVRGQPKVDATTFNVGTLVISRTAKILADGTAENPIIFTTSSTDGTSTTGNRASGAAPAFWDSAPKTSPKSASFSSLWGGLVILGNAPTNVDRDGGFLSSTAATNLNAVGTTAKGTLDQIFYGYGTGTNKNTFSGTYSDGTTFSALTTTVTGDDRPSIEGVPTGTIAYITGVDRYAGFNSDDNSGILRYVSIRHDGANLSDANELNGLTLGAVGRGTTLEYIEIWGSADDGIEIFGGNANLNHLSIMGFRDDGIDLDVGYTGTIQFALVVAGDESDKLGEWDGSYDGETSINGFAVPRSVNFSRTPVANFTIANATFIGNPAVTVGNPQPSVNITDGSHGLILRDQVSNTLVNSILVNPRNTQTALSFNSRSGSSELRTENRFAQGLASFRGVTLYSDSTITSALTNNVVLGTTVGTWIAARPSSTPAGPGNVLSENAGDNTILVAALTGTADNGNLFQQNPGFKKLPRLAATGAFPANFALNPVPGTAVTFDAGSFDAVYADAVGGYVGSLDVVGYRGAFETDPTASLWTTGWTAANLTGFLVSTGNQ